jgi:sorbitol-specific phosphotransferase system component IIBC
VPLVATAILLIGEFVMINVVSLFFSPKVSTIEIFLSGIIPSIPMVAFLFIGFVVAEGFYRFVQWNGLK